MDQLERITQMEQILDKSTAAVTALLTALEAYQDIRPELAQLTAYYQSPDWLADRADDEAGLLPADLKRGVLSEDAVWNLLTDESRAQELMREIVREGH